jgi:hypothetical protein
MGIHRLTTPPCNAMAAAPYLHAKLTTIDRKLSHAAAEAPPSPEKTSIRVEFVTASHTRRRSGKHGTSTLSLPFLPSSLPVGRFQTTRYALATVSSRGCFCISFLPYLARQVTAMHRLRKYQQFAARCLQEARSTTIPPQSVLSRNGSGVAKAR